MKDWTIFPIPKMYWMGEKPFKSKCKKSNNTFQSAMSKLHEEFHSLAALPAWHYLSRVRFQRIDATLEENIFIARLECSRANTITNRASICVGGNESIIAVATLIKRPAFFAFVWPKTGRSYLIARQTIILIWTRDQFRLHTASKREPFSLIFYIMYLECFFSATAKERQQCAAGVPVLWCTWGDISSQQRRRRHPPAQNK